MKFLVDIVNLNADASCLSSKKWLEILSGGEESYLYKLLLTYVTFKKKVSLGIVGSTISDISQLNPEVIFLIKQNPDIFEIILRPYSHDIALLRTRQGFEKNLEIGIKTIEKEFGSYTNYFLPPEFMLTGEQIAILSDEGVEGTFVNPTRFKKEIRARLPEKAYKVAGIYDSRLNCIPFVFGLTRSYLHALHYFDNTEWNINVENQASDFVFCWRDGESPFFLPDGIEREKHWLASESKNIERVFLKDSLPKLDVSLNKNLEENQFHFYPIHSFTAWMKEFRMLGFIDKVKQIEKSLSTMSRKEIAIWLQIINSDILSAIEKDSPIIKLKKEVSSNDSVSHTIWRSERGYEGEEFLAILCDNIFIDNENYIRNSDRPFLNKLNSRIDYLNDLTF